MVCKINIWENVSRWSNSIICMPFYFMVAFSSYIMHHHPTICIHIGINSIMPARERTTQIASYKTKVRIERKIKLFECRFTRAVGIFPFADKAGTAVSMETTSHLHVSFKTPMSRCIFDKLFQLLQTRCSYLFNMRGLQKSSNYSKDSKTLKDRITAKYF